MTTGAVAIGCARSGDAERHQASTQLLVGQTSCEVGAQCELTMHFPSGIHPNELAVVGREGVRVGSGSHLLGQDGAPGALISETGHVELQAGSTVGSIWTHGSAFVGGGSVVSGSFFANEQSHVQAGAVAPERQLAVGSLASMGWEVTFPQGSSGDVWMEPNRDETRAPGRYGNVRIGSRSTLRLTAGSVYFFDSFQGEPDSRVLVEDGEAGTTIIYVRGQFVSRGQLVSTGSPSDILVGSFSTETVELGDQFDATLVAPDARVLLTRPNSNASHDGRYFGREVELQGGVSITGTPLSNTGPAFEDMNPTFTPADGVPLPGPVPQPDGLTWEEWEAARSAYVQELLDENYLGEAIEFEVHPDGAQANELGDFSLPDHANPEVTPAVIAPRSAGSPILPEAEDEFRNEIAQAEQAARARYPALDQPDSQDAPGAQYGTELEPPAEVPEACIFSQQPQPPPTIDPNTQTEIGALDDFHLQPIVPDIVLGNRPNYLTFNERGSGYSINNAALPQFDGYWFFAARLWGGYNGVGMEGLAEASVQAGGVLMKRHVELLRVAAVANGAVMKQLTEEDVLGEDDEVGDVTPHFASEVETRLLGFRISSASWDATAGDPLLAKLRRTLLDESVSLFGGAASPLTFPIGPFSLVVDGGAQVKIPLALNLDAGGPELTLSPMFRVYMTVFAGLNVGFQIGVEGEADIIRVDMPFTAKLKWMDHLTPETCYSSADFKVTYQTVWSTLNGSLFVTVRVKDPFFGKEINIARAKIVSWTGFEADSGEINLIPEFELPLMRHDPGTCILGSDSCATKATPNFRPSIGQTWTVPVPYGQTECPSQYVYEVDDVGEGEVWLRSLWLASNIDTPEECNDALVRVDVWRLLSDGTTWTGWDSYEVLGTWQEGVGCQTIFRNGGRLPDSLCTSPPCSNGFLGFPWSWVDTTGGVQRVRVAVGGGTGGGDECSTRSLSLGVRDSQPD